MAEKGKYCYDYPRPALTSDIIFIVKEINKIEVLLIERKFDPFKNSWAFPGGYVEPDETSLKAAIRELKEETGIDIDHLTQLHTFSDIDRDPRGRTVSVVYYCISDKKPKLNPGDDAKSAQWFSIDDLPALAFDHDKIMEFAKDHLSI